MRTIVPRIVLALMFVIAAAPSAQAQGGSAGAGPFDLQSGRYGRVLSNDMPRTPDTLAIASGKVWSALSLVYEELGIPLTVVDTESHVLGALRVTQRKPLGGERLSRFLECGSGAYGANADRYSVQLTVLTLVYPTGSATAAVDTRVTGSAAPNGLNSSVHCSTSGALEEKITSLLKKRLGL